MHLLFTKAYFFAGIGLAALMLSCNPPATVDQAAANLDVKLTVIDTGPSSSDGKVAVVAQFFLNGPMVQFGSNVTVTCNGVPLTYNGLGYAERVPVASTGGTYTLVYTRNGSPTSMSLAVPVRPVVLTPTAGATVTRSNNLTITYTADGGAGIRASAGDGSTGLGGNTQPDNGTFTGFNVTALHAGAGTLGVSRDLTHSLTGTGFKSAQTSLSISSPDVKVTWN